MKVPIPRSAPPPRAEGRIETGGMDLKPRMEGGGSPSSVRERPAPKWWADIDAVQGLVQNLQRDGIDVDAYMEALRQSAQERIDNPQDLNRTLLNGEFTDADYWNADEATGWGD